MNAPRPRESLTPFGPRAVTHGATKFGLRTLLQWAYGREGGSLSIPDFQRSFAWRSTEIRDCLASVIAGFPIGSLTLARLGPLSRSTLTRLSGSAVDAGARENDFVVIDGRHRLSAILAGFQMYFKGAVSGKPFLSHAWGLNLTPFLKDPDLLWDWEAVRRELSSIRPAVSGDGDSRQRVRGVWNSHRDRFALYFTKGGRLEEWDERLWFPLSYLSHFQGVVGGSPRSTWAGVSADARNWLIDLRADEIHGADVHDTLVARFTDTQMPCDVILPRDGMESEDYLKFLEDRFLHLNGHGKSLTQDDAAVRDTGRRAALEREADRLSRSGLSSVASWKDLWLVIWGAANAGDLAVGRDLATGAAALIRDLEAAKVDEWLEYLRDGGSDRLVAFRSELGVRRGDCGPSRCVTLAALAAFMFADRSEDSQSLQVGACRTSLVKAWWRLSLIDDRFPTANGARRRGTAGFLAALPALRFALESSDPDVALSPERVEAALEGFDWASAPTEFVSRVHWALLRSIRNLKDLETLSDLSLAHADQCIDKHHIFPKAFLRSHAPGEEANCPANLTPLSDVANRSQLRALAPSEMLRSLEEKGHSTQEIQIAWRGHGIPVEFLREDDFGSFVDSRSEWLTQQLRERCGV